MINILSAYIYGLALSITHFLGEELDEWTSEHRQKLVSFTAGITVTYIFLHLLPKFHSLTIGSNSFIFLFPLFGFSSIHLAQKYIRKSGSKEEIKEEHKEVHSAFFFLYHTAVGILIAGFMEQGTVEGFLFFFPILFHTALSSFSLSELHEEVVEKLPVKLAISLSTLLGVFLFESSIISSFMFKAIFGSVTGMFFYIAIKDSIPADEKGCISGYLAGTIFYILIIGLTWI